MVSAPYWKMNPKIHLRGLILAVLGFGLTWVLVATQFALGGRMIVVAIAPVVIGITGLVELLSGYPFYKIAEKWDSMHELVRSFLGILIVIAFMVILIVGASVFLQNG